MSPNDIGIQERRFGNMFYDPVCMYMYVQCEPE